MKIKTLGFWKSVTTWSGFFIALSGSFYALSMGKLDVISACLTFGGLAINGIGNLIGMAQAKRQKEEREAAVELAAEAQARIEELEYKTSDAQELLNDPDFKRLLRREQMQYAEEHQDDGR